jgi:nondiscriminating glutamyl-tRNA synthetase
LKVNPEIRVRFAPAPTGRLHIGNARTALFNVLFARRHKGTLILRIEDTDVERSTEASIADILKDLRWLGIEWQEGPERGGPAGPYRQSERVSLYHDFARQLLQRDAAYKCFCSQERLDALRNQQLAKGQMPRYDGRCRHLSKEEISGLEAQGLQAVVRFRVEGGPVVFEDLIHGRMSFDRQGIGDFILIRSDRMGAYNFACVIDDHLMGVTHVIRGEDHLSNTPRQILLYRALGWEPPVFAHHPLILGPDRSPLSKRHGATTVAQYREEGFLPEALLNDLVLLGWTPPSGEEVLSREIMAEKFSLESVSKSAPIFTRKKLEWLNSIYIRKKDGEELSRLLRPYLENAGLAPDQAPQGYIEEVCDLLKENLVVLSQIEEYLGVFFDEKFSFDEKAIKVLSEARNRETLRTVLQVIDSPEVTDIPEGFLHQLEERTGRKGKELYAPVRAALTGKMKGPELARTLPLLGKERILRRLRMALDVAG